MTPPKKPKPREFWLPLITLVVNSDENRPNGIHVIEVLPQTETVNEDLEAIPASKSFTAKVKINKITKGEPLPIDDEDYEIARETALRDFVDMCVRGILTNRDLAEHIFNAGAEWQKDKDAEEIETIKKKYIVEAIPATVSQIAMIREQTIREVSQLLKDEAKSSTCKFANRADAKRISDYVKSKLLPKRKEQK